MSAALITAVVLSVASLVAGLVMGYTAEAGPDILRHTTWSTFATLLILLSYSLTMFYLIGKGRAVKDAASEGKLSGEFAAAIARARKPVLSTGVLAMALTMATAIIGGGVDTGVVPGVVHAALALAALAANLWAARAAIVALTTSVRVTNEVNRLLGA